MQETLSLIAFIFFVIIAQDGYSFQFSKYLICHENKTYFSYIVAIKVSTAANRSKSFCSQTILSPPFLQFQGLVYEKIEVLFLGIEVFEAFALASLPALQRESPVVTFRRPKHFSA